MLPTTPEPSAWNADYTERVIVGMTDDGGCQIVLDTVEVGDAITLDLAGVVELRKILQRAERRMKEDDR